MNDNKQPTILDYIKDIRVPGDVFKNPSNEYWALICLKRGLDFLYRQVSQIDSVTQARLNPEGKLTR